MLDPKNVTSDLEKWIANAANNIELNLKLVDAKWDDPENRTTLICAIVLMWEAIKKQDNLSHQ